MIGGGFVFLISNEDDDDDAIVFVETKKDEVKYHIQNQLFHK